MAMYTEKYMHRYTVTSSVQSLCGDNRDTRKGTGAGLVSFHQRKVHMITLEYSETVQKKYQKHSATEHT